MFFRILIALLLFNGLQLEAQTEKKAFQYMDVFSLQWADDPQLSPDGKTVVYIRSGFDIMKDKKTSRLWIMDANGQNHRKLTTLDVNESQPRWSKDGSHLAFTAATDEGFEIYTYNMEFGSIARISQLDQSPGNITWSPNGEYIAFHMFVEAKAPSLITRPQKPKGAEWAEPARVTTRLKHESDGAGYLKTGFHHIFTIPAQGGLTRQITNGKYNHKGKLSWGANSKKIFFSANRSVEAEYNFNDSNIFSVEINSKKIKQLSANNGPEYNPVVSPDGKFIAYLAYVDKVQTYQLTRLMVMRIDGSNKKMWLSDVDRSIKSPIWRSDSKTIYYMYDDFGNTKIAKISNAGRRENLATNVGGTTIGRPYASGSFSISNKSDMVYTMTTSDHPAELVFLKHRSSRYEQISFLNQELMEQRDMAEVREIFYKSSVDDRSIQGWIALPQQYDSTKTYPLLVENHGGPILNYGSRFSAEIQLYASNGYLVFYPNPRGSTSYGQEFGNLLFNNYPGDDYQDVMDGVDYLIEEGYTSEDELYVTGGSAGGIMTAWIIGKNNRFQAAVVHKPVINWISKTLVADNYYGYANYRYPDQPWENFETYWKFSPISLVGNIETPTMVLVGMDDLRTPPSEAKQLYHALKLRKIETMLVEFPSTSHSIAARPSNMISKVMYTVAWCDKYKEE